MGLTTQWVEMHLVDCNEHMSCSSAELMHLPEKFQSFPHQAVDMRIGERFSRDADGSSFYATFMPLSSSIFFTARRTISLNFAKVGEFSESLAKYFTALSQPSTSFQLD